MLCTSSGLIPRTFQFVGPREADGRHSDGRRNEAPNATAERARAGIGREAVVRVARRLLPARTRGVHDRS